MENNKKKVGRGSSSSSPTNFDHLFGPKDPSTTSSYSTSIFGSMFPPPSTICMIFSHFYIYCYCLDFLFFFFFCVYEYILVMGLLAQSLIAWLVLQEKIDDRMSQDLENECEISPTDAIGEAFGKEHPRRVRGLGMGVLPTVAFKRTTTRTASMNMGSCGSSTSSQVVQEKLVTMESQIQALCAYIAMKEGGRMPDELAILFPNLTSQAPDRGSGAESPNDIRRSSDGSNNNVATNHTSPQP